MGEYDDLLDEAKSKAAIYMSTAKVYIPKMYNALMSENKNISPQDARDRIEKDCVGIWSRRTILDALPDEAKNQEKQKSGRLGQKKRSSAAFSAAPEAGAVPIILDANGRPISGAIDKSSEHTSKRQVKQNIKGCPNRQELYAANQQLRDDLHASVTADKQIAQKSNEEQFELSVPFKPLLRHMIIFVDSHGVRDRVSFTGKLNIQTRKVRDVRWIYT